MTGPPSVSSIRTGAGPKQTGRSCSRVTEAGPGVLNGALKEAPYVRTVFFLDRTIGFVSGDGFLLRTTDGGKSWRNVGSGGVAFQLSFIDKNNGWAMDSDLKDAFQITKTVDGGASWSITCPSSIQPPCAASTPPNKSLQRTRKKRRPLKAGETL